MLDWTIDFNFIVRLIAWVAAAVALLSLLLVVRVTQLRNTAQRREGQLRRFRAEWEPILSGPPQPREKLPPVRQSDALAWALMWNRAQEATQSLNGDRTAMHAYLNGIASRNSMPARAAQWARGGDVVERLQGITMLGHLRERSAAGLLRELCDSPNALISIAAARALLQIDPAFAGQFVEMIGRRTDWPPGKLVAIVREEHNAIAAPLLELCRTAPVPMARQLVKYLRYLQPAAALPAVLQLLDAASDPETLTGALRVLAEIGTRTDIPAAENLSQHDDWRVRVQAANVLGALGERAQIPVLSAMLDDRHWWVRYRAAQALGAIADRYHADLGPVLGALSDRFAREALAQAMAEREALVKGVAAS